MYKVIKKHPTVRVIYGEQLVKGKVSDQAFVDGFYQEKMDNLQLTLDEGKEKPSGKQDDGAGWIVVRLRRGTKEDFDESFKGTSIEKVKLAPVTSKF
ncbi:MAG: hypothetical protein R2827_03055 [Bdellovibrionales bacterium]